MSENKPKKDGKDKKPGPDEERLKLDGVDWEDAIGHALKKKRPADGWPKKSEESEDEKDGD